jgi:hypothetical protein
VSKKKKRKTSPRFRVINYDKLGKSTRPYLKSQVKIKRIRMWFKWYALYKALSSIPGTITTKKERTMFGVKEKLDSIQISYSLYT